MNRAELLRRLGDGPASASSKNGIEIDRDDDEVFELVMAVAAGELTDVLARAQRGAVARP